MLEALISLRRNGSTEQKPTGYVIALKLPGSPWGGKEVELHQLVEWQDDDLEAQLTAKRNAGEQYPVITLPYATIDEDGNVTCFGTRTVDLPALDDDDVNNPNVNAGKLTWADISDLVSDA